MEESHSKCPQTAWSFISRHIIPISNTWLHDGGAQKTSQIFQGYFSLFATTMGGQLSWKLNCENEHIWAPLMPGGQVSSGVAPSLSLFILPSSFIWEPLFECCELHNGPLPCPHPSPKIIICAAWLQHISQQQNGPSHFSPLLPAPS